MSSSLGLVLGSFLVSCVVINAQLGSLKPRPGSFSPLMPSLDDIRMCKENANGRKYQLTFKLSLQTCRPFCKYENETVQITSMDGQFCCDYGGGVAPTGLCKEGVCMVGGVAGWNFKGGMKTIMD